MNRGAQHLAARVEEWVAEDPKGRSQNAAAALVECDTGNFSKILKGDGRSPGRALAIRIKEHFGTEPQWFDEPAEEPAA